VTTKKPWLSWRNAIIALIVVGIAAYGAHRFLAPPPAPEFVTSLVKRGNLEDTVLATGTVKAFKEVTVGSQASGQVKSLKVGLGDIIKKGDLIAEIDSMTQQNTLRTDEAALLNVQAQLQAKQATLKQAELAYTRAKGLLDQDAGSREDYETAEATLATTRAEIAQLQAQIVQAKITVDTAKVNLGYTRITAPMDGTVVALVTKEGQTVNASQTTPTIITLAHLDQVTIKAQISEADIPRVKPGQKAYFTILGEPDKRYKTTLRAMEPAPDSYTSDSSTTTSSSSTTTSSTSTSSAIYYDGLLDVPNPDRKLRISMTAQVRIVLADAQNALTIPAVALGEKTPDGDYMVRVLDDQGMPSPRKVRIGINNTVSAEVLSGLAEGDKVVLSEASTTAKTDNRRMGPPPMHM
jgi:macrolide-specific efflux system membrane fusion protein